MYIYIIPRHHLPPPHFSSHRQLDGPGEDEIFAQAQQGGTPGQGKTHGEKPMGKSHKNHGKTMGKLGKP